MQPSSTQLAHTHRNYQPDLGVGPKTAGALLACHGTIDALYAALPSLPARQADLLPAHQERVAFNRRLVTADDGDAGCSVT